MVHFKPFLIKPAAKDYLWGGSRLNDDFNLGVDINPFAEAWVCNCHPDGKSIAANYNLTLAELLKIHPEWLGLYAMSVANGEFTILIKLIDAKKDLSVQVHPDDEYAKIYENGSLGKTEMWYVLDAKDNASLIYGFNQNMTESQVRESITTESIENYLNHVEVHKN